MKSSMSGNTTRARRMFVDKYNVFLIVILAIVIFVFGLSTKRFLSVRNFSVIVSQSAEIGLMGLGMGLVTMVNGVDLSVNDTANLSALIAGLFLKAISQNFSSISAPFFILITVLIAISIGFACGSLNGLLVGYLRIPPILATLGYTHSIPRYLRRYHKRKKACRFPQRVFIDRPRSNLRHSHTVCNTAHLRGYHSFCN